MKYVGGYDHNYALREAPGERMKMAEAHSDKTGITLEAFTTCCGVQLYAGNFITPQKGKRWGLIQRAGWLLPGSTVLPKCDRTGKILQVRF
ncbi:MAG: hypothetical protein ACLTSZ_10335 [Lachnospiraceae bacterium]